MKQSIYKYLFAALLLLGVATSCYDPLTADISVSSIRMGKEFVASLSLEPMENDIVTKSQYAGSDAAVSNWNLFIYDSNGSRVGAYYKVVSGTSDSRIKFKVRLDETYHYYAIANVGDMVSSAPATLTGLSNFVVTFSAGSQQTSSIAANLGAMPAAGTADVEFTSEQYRQSGGDLDLNIPLTRLVSRYDISVIKGPHDNQSGLQDWDFDVTSLTLNGVNTVKPFVAASYGSNNSTVNDRATAADLVRLNSDNSITVYPLENIVNVPAAISSPWQKVPSTVGNSLYPSFITVKGTATLKDGSGKTKEVTYNFYLGQNATDDFKVIRNTVNTVKLYLSDENIWSDTEGRWKVEPGPFNDDRSLRFTRNMTEPTSSQNPVLVRAGQSLNEAITRKVGSTDKNFKYNVSFGGGLAPSGNTVRMSVLDANSVKQTSLSSIDFNSLNLVAEDGIDAEGYVRIYTIATPDPGSNLLNGHIKEDKLYVKIYNAWMDVDQTEIVWDWNEIAAKTANVRSTVNWGSNGSSLSSVYTVTPLSTTSPSSNPGIAVSVTPVNVNNLVTDATTNLVFSAAGLEDKTVVLRQRSKPQVYIPGNTDGFVNLEWEPGQNGVGDKQTVTFRANEDWEVVWDSSFDAQKSHWSYSPANGGKTTGDNTVSIDIYPVAANTSIAAVPGSFKIVPKRNNVQVPEGAFTVNLSHKKDAAALSVSPSSLTWAWSQYGNNDQGSKTITVTGNVAWTASFQNASDADLWSLSQGSGSGNATLTVYPKAANGNMDAPADKDANVVIHCTSVVDNTPSDKVVSLKQTKHPTVKTASPVSNMVWPWNDNSTDNSISVVADTGWEVVLSVVSESGFDSKVSDWVMTPNPASGSSASGTVVSFRPAAQNTSTVLGKKVKVTLRATDTSLGIPNIEFYLIQNAKPAAQVTTVELEYSYDSASGPWYKMPATVVIGDKLYYHLLVHYDSAPDEYLTSGFDLSLDNDHLSKDGNNTTAVSEGTTSVSVTYQGKTSNAISVTVQAPYIDVDTTPITFNASEGASVFKNRNVDSNVICGASIDNPGDFTLEFAGFGYFYVRPNSDNINGTSDRTATVTLTYGSIVKTVPVIHYHRRYDGMLNVSPANANVTVGNTIQLAASYQQKFNDEGFDSIAAGGTWTNSGSASNVTGSSSWSVVSASPSGCLSVDNGSNKGRVTGNAEGSGTVRAEYSGKTADAQVSVQNHVEYRNLSISLNPDAIDDVNNLSSTATALADRYVNNVLDQGGVDVTSSTSFQVLEENPPVTQSGNVFTWNNSDGDDTDITIRGTFSGMTADATLLVKKKYEAQPRYFIDVTGFKIYDSSENEASDITVNYGGSESYSVKAVVDVFYGTARWSATYEGTEEVNVSASNVSWNWTGDSEYANGRTVSNTNQTGTDKQVVFSSATASRTFIVSCHSASEFVIKNHTLSSSAFTVTLPSEDVTPTYKVVTSANPDELQVGEFTSLSATLYSSTDGGLNWTVVSSSPDGFVKASGDAVINTSTGKAVATGTGTYYGQFNGYTIDVYENASVTVTPATIYKVVTSATRTELNVNDLQTKITELSAVLYSSTDGGVNWTLEPNSPDRFEFVPGSGVDILTLSSNIGVASTYGKGTYHGVFDGSSVDTYEGVVITAHETHYDNLVVEFEREWFAAGTSITVAAYVDEYTDGKKTTSRIDVTSDAQFASVSGNISVSGSTVTSTGSYYGVATVSGTYGSLVSYADINIQSLVALSFGETDIYFGSLGTKTVSINGVWSNYPNSGSVEIPITTYFPYQIRFFDYGTDLDGRVTWSNTGRNSEKYTSNPTLTISRPSSYHSSYVKTSPGRYELPVNLYVAEFPHLSYELTPYIELIETELNYSPKETQTNTTSINVEFSAVLGLDGSGEAWNTYSGHAVEVAYTWETKWPSINNERWTISHPANSNSLYIQFKGFVGDEDSASQVFTIGQQPNAHQFVVTADRAGSTYTNMSVAPN